MLLPFCFDIFHPLSETKIADPKGTEYTGLVVCLQSIEGGSGGY